MKDWIESQLKASLQPSFLEIIDDSHLHVGHPGNTGGGHYLIRICSIQFNNLSLIKRHRLVNETLKTEIGRGIHALQILAWSPDEPEKHRE